MKLIRLFCLVLLSTIALVSCCHEPKQRKIASDNLEFPQVTDEVQFDNIPTGNPDLKCSDQYGAYYIFNIKTPKSIFIAEPRGRAALMFPHIISNVQFDNNYISLDSTLNMLTSIEKYKMKLDLSRKTLTIFSLKTQKTYVLACE